MSADWNRNFMYAISSGSRASTSDLDHKIQGLLKTLADLKTKGHEQSTQLTHTKYSYNDLQDFCQLHKTILGVHVEHFKLSLQYGNQDLALNHPELGIDSLWFNEILPSLSTLERVKEKPKFIRYLEYSYTILITFHSYCTVPRVDILQFLGYISLCKARLSEKHASREFWYQETHRNFTSATLLSPETGLFHYYLGLTYQDGSWHHLAEVVKSIHAFRPHMIKRTELCQLFTRARLVQIDPLPVLLIDTLLELLGGSSEKLEGPVGRWKSKIQLKNFLARHKSAFQGFGLFIAFSLLSSLFEFGASRSILQIYQLGQKPNLHPYDRLASIDAINRASQIVFPIFSTMLDFDGNSNVYPMAHAFLAFLQSTSTRPECYTLFEEFVPREKIVKFLNRLRAYENSFVAQIGLRQPLPEDKEMASLIFYTGLYDNNTNPVSCQNQYTSTALPLASWHRRARIMEVARQLGQTQLYFTDNGHAFEVSRVDRRMGQNVACY